MYRRDGRSRWPHRLGRMFGVRDSDAQRHLSGLRFAVATTSRLGKSGPSGLPCTSRRSMGSTLRLALWLFGFRLPAQYIF